MARSEHESRVRKEFAGHLPTPEAALDRAERLDDRSDDAPTRAAAERMRETAEILREWAVDAEREADEQERQEEDDAAADEADDASADAPDKRAGRKTSRRRSPGNRKTRSRRATAGRKTAKRLQRESTSAVGFSFAEALWLFAGGSIAIVLTYLVLNNPRELNRLADNMPTVVDRFLNPWNYSKGA